MKLIDVINNDFENKIIRPVLDDLKNFDMKKAKEIWMLFFGKVSGKKEIVVDDENKKTWNLLINYTYNIENEIDNMRGVYLCGNTGSGKSVTMKTLYSLLKFEEMKYYRNNKVCSFAFEYTTAAKLIEMFSEEGFEGIIWATKINSLYIDDIGNEVQCNYFGNRICVISHIIERRYDNNLFTHFSSNYRIKDLKYDERIRSRITEMTNEIILAGKDYRTVSK